MQGGPLAHQISIGSKRVTLSSRVTRVLLTLMRLPSFLFTLVTFRAQQILLGNTIVKLVLPGGFPWSCAPMPELRLPHPFTWMKGSFLLRRKAWGSDRQC